MVRPIREILESLTQGRIRRPEQAFNVYRNFFSFIFHYDPGLVFNGEPFAVDQAGQSMDEKPSRRPDGADLFLGKPLERFVVRQLFSESAPYFGRVFHCQGQIFLFEDAPEKVFFLLRKIKVAQGLVQPYVAGPFGRHIFVKKIHRLFHELFLEVLHGIEIRIDRPGGGVEFLRDGAGREPFPAVSPDDSEYGEKYKETVVFS